MDEKINWMQILGFTHSTVEDIRFVGYSYLKEGQYQIALKFFEALTILNPTSTYDFQTLGALYLQTGQLQYALNYLERALRLEPLHELTRLNKLKTLFLLGYHKQGIKLGKELMTGTSLSIRNKAEALLLAYD